MLCPRSLDSSSKKKSPEVKRWGVLFSNDFDDYFFEFNSAAYYVLLSKFTQIANNNILSTFGFKHNTSHPKITCGAYRNNPDNINFSEDCYQPPISPLIYLSTTGFNHSAGISNRRREEVNKYISEQMVSIILYAEAIRKSKEFQEFSRGIEENVSSHLENLVPDTLSLT